MRIRNFGPVSFVGFSFALVLIATAQEARAACGWWEILWCEDSKPATPTPQSSGPARDDLVRAVKNHVSSKSYEERVTQVVEVSRRCTQADVDRDIHMPNNPELAKCPRVGATYLVRRNQTTRIARPCAGLPGSESGWSVSNLGNNRWRVGLGGSSWVLTQLSGQVQGNGVTRVASFAFRIEANQRC